MRGAAPSPTATMVRSCTPGGPGRRRHRQLRGLLHAPVPRPAEPATELPLAPRPTEVPLAAELTPVTAADEPAAELAQSRSRRWPWPAELPTKHVLATAQRAAEVPLASVQAPAWSPARVRAAAGGGPARVHAADAANSGGLLLASEQRPVEVSCSRSCRGRRMSPARIPATTGGGPACVRATAGRGPTRRHASASGARSGGCAYDRNRRRRRPQPCG